MVDVFCVKRGMSERGEVTSRNEGVRMQNTIFNSNFNHGSDGDIELFRMKLSKIKRFVRSL